MKNAWGGLDPYARQQPRHYLTYRIARQFFNEVDVAGDGVVSKAFAHPILDRAGGQALPVLSLIHI